MKNNKVVKKVILILLMVIGLTFSIIMIINLSSYEKRVNLNNYINGLQYINKNDHLNELQDYSINNLSTESQDDRLTTIYFDNSSKVKRNVNFEDENGVFSYELMAPSNLTNLISLEYKDNTLIKTIGNWLYSDNQDDVEFRDNQEVVSVEYDFDLFVSNTSIKSYIDFSNAKIKKLTIDSKNRRILVEGNLKENLELHIPCLNISLSLDKPSFSYYVSYAEDNPYSTDNLEITFKDVYSSVRIIIYKNNN